MSQYKFKINGKEFEVAVNSIENNIASVNVNGVEYSVELDSTIAAAPASASVGGVAPETHATLGTVRGGTVSGDAVKRGQKIAVIEAMKMENDILAESDGTVSAIYVKKTDSVLEGADIASIA